MYFTLGNKIDSVLNYTADHLKVHSAFSIIKRDFY